MTKIVPRYLDIIIHIWALMTVHHSYFIVNENAPKRKKEVMTVLAIAH